MEQEKADPDLDSDLDDDDDVIEYTCPLCLEELLDTKLGNPRLPVALKCDDKLRHIFHKECIDKWREGPLAINKKCPICRKDPLEEDQVRRVSSIVRQQVARGRSRWRWWYNFKEIPTHLKNLKDDLGEKHWRIVKWIVGINFCMLCLFALITISTPRTIPFNVKVHYIAEDIIPLINTVDFEHPALDEL